MELAKFSEPSSILKRLLSLTPVKVFQKKMLLNRLKFLVKRQLVTLVHKQHQRIRNDYG